MYSGDVDEILTYAMLDLSAKHIPNINSTCQIKHTVAKVKPLLLLPSVGNDTSPVKDTLPR